jgi:predicted DNA-binding protein
MATKKTRAARPDSSPRAANKMKHEAKPVALTVKVTHEVYVRLCTMGANERRTNQDILQEAVQEYLDRLGA